MERRPTKQTDKRPTVTNGTFMTKEERDIPFQHLNKMDSISILLIYYLIFTSLPTQTTTDNAMERNGDNQTATLPKTIGPLNISLVHKGQAILPVDTLASDRYEREIKRSILQYVRQGEIPSEETSNRARIGILILHDLDRITDNPYCRK